jgi:hypothetical protein
MTCERDARGAVGTARPKRGFLVQGDDRVGAFAELLERLGAAKINVSAIDALCVADGRYGAIFWVAPKDVKKAAALLGASWLSAARGSVSAASL